MQVRVELEAENALLRSRIQEQSGTISALREHLGLVRRVDLRGDQGTPGTDRPHQPDLEDPLDKLDAPLGGQDCSRHSDV